MIEDIELAGKTSSSLMTQSVAVTRHVESGKIGGYGVAVKLEVDRRLVIKGWV